MSDDAGENRALRWARLLHEESEAFERVRRNQVTASPAQRENFAREWFAAANAVLMMYLRSIVALHEGGPLVPAPGDVIGRAARLMEGFSVGVVPQVVDDINANGRPGYWPGERRDIAVALDYIRHVETGAIVDRKPNVTVHNAFDVDRTTVQNWAKDRERICAGLPQAPAECFPEALEHAGGQYQFNRTESKKERENKKTKKLSKAPKKP